MRLRKLAVTAGLVALPVAGAFLNSSAEAAAWVPPPGPCTVTLGTLPSAGAPTATVNPRTGEVYFKPGKIDSGSPSPHVVCFGIAL